MFERPGRVADYFPPPFPNDAAARVSNGGALPPDMSVIAKARTYERGFPRFLLDVVTQYQEQGVDYITALLKGYEKAPEGMQMAQGMMYNKYFPGHGIAMPPPISDGQVSYDDGSPATVDQYARDVSAFLRGQRSRISRPASASDSRWSSSCCCCRACSISPRSGSGTRWNCTRKS